MFDGWTASRGIDPLALTLDRFVSLAYYWATRNMDEGQLRKFEGRLWRPPPGAQPQGPWSPEAETALFRHAKAMTSQPAVN